MHTLLFSENEADAVNIINYLSPLHHSLKVVHTGTLALQYLRSSPIDAVILDCQIPNAAVLKVLRWVRTRADNYCGAILLSSPTEEFDVVNALDAGADVYMAKPFCSLEFAARVHALLRRLAPRSPQEGLVRAGSYTLNLIENSVYLREIRVDLTKKEFQLIKCLFLNIGKVMSRELLAATAWGQELGIESRSLDTHIYRIRQKLKLCVENGLRLSSVYTSGYRLDQTRPAEIVLPRTPTSTRSYVHADNARHPA